MTINLDKLYEIGDLTYSEYIFLYLIYNKKKTFYFKQLDNVDITQLESKGYLKIISGNQVSLRQKAINLFESEVDLFREFFLLYPVKTGNGRVLRTEKPDTVQYNNSRKEWLRAFKSKPAEEKRAVEALRTEIAFRKKTDAENFYVGMEKWIKEGYYDRTYDLSSVAGSTPNNSYSFDELN